MNPTSSYVLPLVPAAVILGACIFLIFVPVLALAAVIGVAIAILSALAVGIGAFSISLYRWSRSRFHVIRERLAQRRQAGGTGVPAEAIGARPGQAHPMQLPINSKGIQ